jgi:unsaturated chondroitin disaccharide hydrolase
MITIREEITPADLASGVDDLLEVGAKSIRSLRDTWDPEDGSPVFTRAGRYVTRGWTEWTEGFLYGSALLLFEATGDEEFLEYGRSATISRMAPHVSHAGVHDHGFNNVSTYGALLRFMAEGLLPEAHPERKLYELALKVSGATQANRWTPLPEGLGYVHSFNGAHSLFADTIRSMRSLCLAHQLGHTLSSEQDEQISLLGRALTHAETTARYNVYFGEGRDSYDIRGRVAHESLFNVRSGTYRSPSSQQGYSPFTTWTRGLAWILAGFAELLEYAQLLTDEDLRAARYTLHESADDLKKRYLDVATAVADFYLANTPTDGVPYWDTGAPGLTEMGDYLDRPADPVNRFEPVDSSAAAIAAQGLIRLGCVLGAPAAEAATSGRAGRGAGTHSAAAAGARYLNAGLSVLSTLFGEPYLASDPEHQGIILHSVYHRPNGWDYIPPGQSVPNGESSMWGDYHALEAAVMVRRLTQGRPPQRFFTIGSS